MSKTKIFTFIFAVLAIFQLGGLNHAYAQKAAVVNAPTCPAGTTYTRLNNQVYLCISTKTGAANKGEPSCSGGGAYSYTNLNNTVLSVCTEPITCPTGTSVTGGLTTDPNPNVKGAVCTTSATNATSCASGATFNSAKGKCVTKGTCGSKSTYNELLSICVNNAAPKACPSGTTLTPVGNDYAACATAPICATGKNLDKSTGTCK